MRKVAVRKLATMTVGVLLAAVTAAAHGEECSLTGPPEIYVPMVHSSCGDDCFTHVLAAEEELSLAIELVCPAGATPAELSGSSEFLDAPVVLNDDFIAEPTATVTAEMLEEICQQRLGEQWPGNEYHPIEGPDLNAVLTFEGSCTPAGQERAPTCTREVTVVCADHCLPAQYWERVKDVPMAQLQPGSDPGPPYCLCSWSVELSLGYSDGKGILGLHAIYHLPRFRSLQLDLGTRDGSEPGESRVDLVDLSYSKYLRPTKQLNPRLFFGAGWAFVDASSQGPRPRLDDGPTLHLGAGIKWSFLNRRKYLSFDVRARWHEEASGSGFEFEATAGFGFKGGCCGNRIRGPRRSDRPL